MVLVRELPWERFIFTTPLFVIGRVLYFYLSASLGLRRDPLGSGATPRYIVFSWEGITSLGRLDEVFFKFNVF